MKHLLVNVRRERTRCWVLWIACAVSRQCEMRQPGEFPQRSALYALILLRFCCAGLE